MDLRRGARRLVGVFGAGTVLMAVPGVAYAQFQATAGATMTANSGALGSPSNLSASACTVVQGVRQITLTWVATPDTNVQGYDLSYTANGAPGSIHAFGANRSASSAVFRGSHNVTYTFTLASYRFGWTSAATPATTAVTC